MFFQSQPLIKQKEYQNFLEIVWCLSNLFSDSNIPYLHYRIAENVFCQAFEAENLSRSDVSVDAKKNLLWIGLKTFLAWNYKTFQKIAEFNSDKMLYEWLSSEKLVRKVAELRNKRIEFTETAHALEKSIYHCVIREANKFLIFEEAMDQVNLQNIKNIKNNKGSISFDDWNNEYSFLLSKSTLTKRFLTSPTIFEFSVEILENPLEELHKIYSRNNLIFETKSRIKETIFLPLYWRDRFVFQKSWLNQWNAGWRKRDISEVYIPIPAEVHRNFSGFFPGRDTPFNLKLPNWKTMSSKLCQDWSKALMSQSNRELWKWILRDILKLNEGELVTYEKLQILGIDSVRIDKIDDSNFEINFSWIGSYEDFKSNFLM